MMRVFLGIDCGATNLRTGIFSEEGKLLASSKIHSPLKSNPSGFAEAVASQAVHSSSLSSLGVEDLRGYEGWEVLGIGVGTPGPLDLQKGLILPSANIGNKEPIDLKTQFERLFNTKICFDRDTNLALLGESWQGIAKDYQDVVMLTLGSGVGGAVMVNGELERGLLGKAGEIGHMIIQDQRSKIKDQKLITCGLGHEGCLEALINSTKDPLEMAYYLGLGLSNIVNILAPEMIVLGGGKVEYLGIKKEEFLKTAVEVMRKEGTAGASSEVKVVYGKLGDLAGVYGGYKLINNQSPIINNQTIFNN